ncbi:MAG: site-2 protease family protein [Myxococcales bacterium]|nr:site-2 protease family protein [Myxococcales bacterium]MCB9582556.1 site-2 protease family protein [Polyangiaceae bacterium]
MSDRLGSFPPPSSPILVQREEPAPRESEIPEPEEPSFDWRTNALLFALTVLSVFFVGRSWTATDGTQGLASWASAWTFAVPLLAILLSHEFGHYIAARIHRVPASLPYFLPLPVLNPFGTLGAVIIMPRRIRSANALLDIGAAGPLAGMVVAIPVMLYGLSLSHLGPVGGGDGTYIQEGQSLLYWGLKALVFGHIPANMDVQLHPTALAAWVGFLITFLNLIPVGQLDGGHVAYSLFGQRQNRFARWLKFAPVLLLIYNFVLHMLPALRQAAAGGISSTPIQVWMPGISSVMNWFFLALLIFFMGRAGGGKHPPVDETHAELSPVRKVVAVVTLLLFVALFMPSPWVVY